MSLISTGKDIIQRGGDYLVDTFEDVKRGLNSISKKPKTLSYYGIDRPTTKDLYEALIVFNTKTRNPNNTTAQELINVLKHEKYTLDVKRLQDIFTELLSNIKDPEIQNILSSALENQNFTLNKDLKRLLNKELQSNTENKEIINNITNEEEILGLMMYAYCIHFWEIHIKDGNEVNQLKIPKLSKSRPNHPGEKPLKPKKEDFSSSEDFYEALSQRRQSNFKRKQEYKERNSWSCNTKRGEYAIQYFTDLGPLNHSFNAIVKHLSNALSLIFGIGEQDLMKTKYKPNILDMSYEEKRELRHIVHDLTDGEKFFVLLNHDTFANIPVFIMKLQQVAKELGIDEFNKKYLSTVIGNHICANRIQECGINTLSSIIPTTPATNDIPGAAPICKKTRKDAGDQIKKELTETNSGKMVICSPSGTRDIFYIDQCGNTKIIIPDAKQTSNRVTLPLARELQSKGVHIITASTNTTELKKPNLEKGVNTNNKEYHEGTVNLHIKEIRDKDRTYDSIIQQIAEGITSPIPTIIDGKESFPRDKDGKINEVQCGKAIPPDIFDYIKKNYTKTEDYQKTGKLPEEILDENGDINESVIREMMKNEQK